MRFAVVVAEKLAVSKVIAPKGNGPDASNIRPAKTQTKYATDFIALCDRPASPTTDFMVKSGGGIGQPLQSINDPCYPATLLKLLKLLKLLMNPAASTGRDTALQIAVIGFVPVPQCTTGLATWNEAQQPRPLHWTAAFQFLTPSCAGRMASFLAGRVGTPARVCWSFVQFANLTRSASLVWR